MESSRDSTRQMEMLLAKIASLATALLPLSKAFIKKIVNNKVVVGTSSGELAILNSDLTERNILNIKMKKSIRNLAVGIDQSKIFVVSDDLRIYLIDLEKNHATAEGFYEGHLDLITGIDTIPNGLTFATW